MPLPASSSRYSAARFCKNGDTADTGHVEDWAHEFGAEALRLFEGLEAKGDGWLLPPEARLDRALCLATLGRREEARQLLLRTGDSRFQEALDRTLERVASGPAPRK